MQLKVRVVEGRQLQGNNISPVCRVSVRRQVKQTDVCPSTNAPVWNKSFVFTFNTSVAEIVDDILMFEVCQLWQSIQAFCALVSTMFQCFCLWFCMIVIRCYFS